MKSGVVNRRGLSPVVASVLLILLVIVLASMIFLWARGFIDERFEKFGKPIDEYCDAVDFKAEIIYHATGDALEVSNRGNVDIYRLDIKKSKGGDSETQTFDFQIDAGSAIPGKPFDIAMADGSNATRIIAYPVLLGNSDGGNENKPFTCLDAGATLLNNEN